MKKMPISNFFENQKGKIGENKNQSKANHIKFNKFFFVWTERLINLPHLSGRAEPRARLSAWASSGGALKLSLSCANGPRVPVPFEASSKSAVDFLSLSLPNQLSSDLPTLLEQLIFFSDFYNNGGGWGKGALCLHERMMFFWNHKAR